MKSGSVSLLTCVTGVALILLASCQYYEDSRPYLQVLPDGNLVISAAPDRNLSLKSTGSGMITINGVGLPGLSKPVTAVCDCSNGGTCVGNGICICPENWQGANCTEDVNECRQNATMVTCLNGGTCTNTPGGFSCNCLPEFGGRFCETPFNDCSDLTCGNGSCVDLARTRPGIPAFRCICNSGWKQSSSFSACNQDVDECLEGVHTCSRYPRVTCINLPGTYRCGPCPAGYNTVGRDCIDVDECATTRPCSRSPQVTCTNTPGSYICGACPNGYEGDGRRCLPVDRCQSGASLCHPLAVCVAVENSLLPQCNCPPGYTGGGYGPSGCFPLPGSSSALCSNNTCFNGGTCHSPENTNYFTCICRAGFTGTRCEVNINDCTAAGCDNGGTCVDQVNGFQCSCPPRYTGQFCENEAEVCGGLLMNASGTLVYPQFQSGYNNSMDCEWRILTMSTRKVIEVELLRMNLEDNKPQCMFDYVEIRDGPSTAFPLLFPRLCGRTVPAAKNSTRNVVTIRFHSDESYVSLGFMLRWKIVNPQCGGLVMRPFGTISSPGYPGPYPERRTCVWRILQVPGSTIQFNFAAIDIQQSGNCSSDFLKVYDGIPPFGRSTLLGTYCGQVATLAPIQTSTALSTLIFSSSSSNPANQVGFNLHYSSSRTCGFDSSSASGVISFPYSGHMNSPTCHWYISLPDGKRIKYRFEYLDLVYSTGCSNDYVELSTSFDTLVSGQLGKYCGHPGNESLATGITPGNSLLVTLNKELSLSRGFRLRYETACGGVFTGHIGSFSSPSYPNFYPNNSNCEYFLMTGVSQRVVLRFTDVDLSQSDCIEIFDGPSVTESPLLRRSCGRQYTFEVNSTSSSLSIKFLGENGGLRGFRANYESIGFDCGGVLTDLQGTIRSPEFPGQYPHGVSCYWAISAPPGHVIRLSFSRFGLETHRNCMYDFVYVYEDSTVNWNGTIGKFCGRNLPPVITSFSNNLHVKFSSDVSISDVGFSATYVALDAHEACGGELRHSYGLIRSPNYPNRYRNSIDCQWTIVGNPGTQIKLNISRFELEAPNARTGRCYDYLEIRQGSFATSPLIEKLCGASLRKRVFVSFSNKMSLRFVTDSSITRKGFSIHFDSTATGCGGIVSSPTGSIMSPNFPLHYDHHADCFWNIHVAKGNRILATLPIVDLENHASCRYDFIEIRDGGPNGRKLGRYCNQTSLPQNLASSQNQMWLRFRSDRSIRGSGFMLNYQTVCRSIELTALHGKIESPGYPDVYPRNLNCSWKIRAPSGNRINITFAMLDVSQRQPNCSVDYLALYDNNQGTRSLLGRFCGYSIPDMISSRSNIVEIEFVTGSNSGQGAGFALEYLMFGCGEILTHDVGILEYSTPEPSQFGMDPNVECRWVIKAPVGKRIQLRISEMSVGELAHDDQGQRCEFASLEIYNAPNAIGHPTSTLCGSLASDRNFTSTGNFLTLHLNPIETFPNERSRLRAWYQFIDGGCGGSFSVPSGNISSPIQPGTEFYPNNVFCQWYIHSQPLHAVNLTFTKFDLEDSSSNQCRYDHVDVFDGFYKENNRTRLLRHCGRQMPFNRTLISSHGNDMLVEMKADGSIQHEGFRAMFSEYCGATVNLTDSKPSTEFSSPNHPRPYPLGANCTWIFRAPPGHRIILEFTRFDLSNTSLNSCHSWLKVFDGEPDDSIELSTPICGNRLPPSIFSPSSVMVVKFHSDLNLIPKRGFLATASLLDNSYSCGREIEADHGLVTSPMYPSSYLANSTCIWILKAPPGNKVSIQFREFYLQQSQGCSHDFVELRENAEGGQLLTNRLCGRNPSGLNSIRSANKVWLKFSTDSTIERRGFMLQFQTVYGGDLVGKSGQLASPNYPRNFHPSMDVFWTITVNQFFVIKLDFLDFDLGSALSSANCQSDYLGLRDGSTHDSPIIESPFCGRRPTRRVVYSSGNTLFLHFHSDSSIESRGFLANWTAIPWSPRRPGSISTRCSFEKTVNTTTETTIRHPSGNLSSSFYCVWRVKSSPSGHVHLNITSLSLPYSRGCRNGYLAIYEKIYDSVTPIRRLCGTQVPTTPLHTSSNRAIIVFRRPRRSYLTTRQYGFQLSAIEKCGSFVALERGNISSPNYPNSYPANSSCAWTIMARSGRTIAAQFSSSFGINDAVPQNCSDNYVQVTTNTRKKYCGGRSPNDRIQSVSNYLTVNFQSVSSSSPGFQLNFHEIPHRCGDRFSLSLENPSVTLTSPSYPQNYPPHLDCRWLISAPPGHSIRIHFDVIDIENSFSNQCPHDSVELHDGSTLHAPRLASVCGNEPISTLRTTDNSLLIRFMSDSSIQRTGFKMNVDISPCGGAIYGRSGSLASPNYPSNYGSSQDCEWLLKAPFGHSISIKFDHFYVGQSRSYLCRSGEDSVKIYDGTSSSSDPLLRTLCGNLQRQLPIVVNTSSSEAVVKFTSNNDRVSATGFSATFTSSIEECGGEINSDSGTIQSPNWPRPYPHLRKCRWTIRVRPGRRVSLRFTNFSLEDPHRSTNLCIYDFVNVSNGNHLSAPVIKTFCGNSTPDVVKSSMNEMAVLFRTDGSLSSGGFRAVFTSNEPAVCGGTIAIPPSGSGVQGTITSPNYGTNSTYENNIWCVWKFVAPAGRSGTLLFRFQDLRLEHRSDCPFDHVIIHEGSTLRESDTLSMGQFCHINQSQEVPSALGPSSVFVEFTTDYSVVGAGFNLTYQYYPCGGRISLEPSQWLRIANPGFPLTDNSPKTCAWLARGSEGSRVRFKVDDLSLACSIGNLTIHNGPSMTSPELTTFCDSASAALNTEVAMETSQARIIYRLTQSSGKFRLSLKAPVGLCGGIIHSFEGNISSPNYPQRYQGGSTCTWVLAVPSGYHYKFSFSPMFDIPQSSSNCPDNYIEVYEFPTSQSSTQLAAISNPQLVPNRNQILPKTCGTTSAPPGFNSTENGVTIRFFGLTPASGFQLKWTVECGEIFTAESGEISSPGFPSNYRDNLTCDYVLQLSTSTTLNSRFIILEFVEFTVEPAPNCQYDYLEIKSGNSTDIGESYGKFCGTSRPQSVTVPARPSALLRFRTDDAVTFPGFLIRYRTTSCGGYLSESSGSFGTPASPQDYPHRSDCRWTIEAPQGRVVVLTFEQMEIEASSRCVFDYVEVYDGADDAESSQLMGRYCGLQPPGEIRSSGRNLFVRFHSDHSGNGLGFRASYIQTFACGGVVNVTLSGGSISSLDSNNDGFYETGLECVWHLQINPPIPNRVMSVTFDDFDLPRNCNSYGDFIQVIDGAFASSSTRNSSRKYCGSSLRQKMITSTHSSLTIVFKSMARSRNNRYRGFTMRYGVIRALCGGQFNASASPTVLRWTPPSTLDSRVGRHVMRCLWRIVSPSSTSRVNITLSHLNIPTSPQCQQSYLEFDDNHNHSLPSHYCGNSSSNNLPVVFHSIGDLVTVVYSGTLPTYQQSQSQSIFELTYQQLGCNRTYSGSSGRITSPGFPSKYSNSIDCQTKIQSRPGTKLSLYFSLFEIESHRSCHFDYLRIHSGSNDQAPVVGRFCNTSALPSPIFLQSNQAFLHFHTDSSVHYSGYDITYIASLTSGCGGNLSHVNGTFTSPNYPQAYPANLSCVWKIKLPSRYRINVEFPKFEMLSSTSCSTDFLAVYFGETPVPQTIFCGSTSVVPFIINSNSATIRFRSGALPSNRSREIAGFRLIYRGIGV